MTNDLHHAVGERVDIAAMINGMADCIFALGVLLAQKGVLDRREFADALERLIEEQRRQGIGDPEFSSVVAAADRAHASRSGRQCARHEAFWWRILT